VSRSSRVGWRFLAISEFGPQTYIYHEGARYQINRVILSPDAEASRPSQAEEKRLVTESVKRCDDCGYMHKIDTPPGPDVCTYCATELGAAWPNLLRMQNVSTQRRERITSDEEERRRMGYEVISGMDFADRAGARSVTEVEVLSASTGDGAEQESLLRLAYGDTATIWRVNLGWRRRRPGESGFVLDVERGYWARREGSDDPEDPMSPRTERVVPYVTDTRNALLIMPAEPLDTETMASLQAALKPALEVVFQLESNELAAEPLPSRDNRRLLLFYESAEGGAGVLRRLIHEPDTWWKVAEEALQRCHFRPKPEQQIDVTREECEAACYDCLLTYSNQLDHGLLDRAKVASLLEQLETCHLSHTAHTDRLPTDSPLEDAFLSRLEDGGYRPPDRSQVLFESARTRPDFVYDDACAVVYIDGPHHDYPERAARDRHANRAMQDLGYRVIRFGYRDDWDGTIGRYPSVFGPGHTRDTTT